jgi:hypothetical protein
VQVVETHESCFENADDFKTIHAILLERRRRSGLAQDLMTPKDCLVTPDSDTDDEIEDCDPSPELGVPKTISPEILDQSQGRPPRKLFHGLQLRGIEPGQQLSKWQRSERVPLK